MCIMKQSVGIYMRRYGPTFCVEIRLLVCKLHELFGCGIIILYVKHKDKDDCSMKHSLVSI